MEANVAVMLKQLDVSYDVPDIEIEAQIRKIEQQTSLELDAQQAEAVKEAVRNGLLVITGGPGTGKTTTIKEVTLSYNDFPYRISDIKGSSASSGDIIVYMNGVRGESYGVDFRKVAD